MNGPHEPAAWSRQGETQLLHTRIFDVASVRFHHPRRDVEREFVVLQPPDWCNVVAVTRAGEIVLVSQYRYGIEELSLELPGGVIEAGEDPLEAGLRELQEESGYGGGQARLIGRVHPNPAIQTNHCHFALVENAELVAPVGWDPDEELAVVLAPVAEVLAWARSGRITHSLTVGALFFFEGLWRPPGR